LLPQGQDQETAAKDQPEPHAIGLFPAQLDIQHQITFQEDQEDQDHSFQRFPAAKPEPGKGLEEIDQEALAHQPHKAQQHQYPEEQGSQFHKIYHDPSPFWC
jgi:hypothetical protein